MTFLPISYSSIHSTHAQPAEGGRAWEAAMQLYRVVATTLRRIGERCNAYDYRVGGGAATSRATWGTCASDGSTTVRTTWWGGTAALTSWRGVRSLRPQRSRGRWWPRGEAARWQGAIVASSRQHAHASSIRFQRLVAVTSWRGEHARSTGFGCPLAATAASPLMHVAWRRLWEGRRRWGQNWYFIWFLSHQLDVCCILMFLVSYSKLSYFWSVFGQISRYFGIH